jgi:hypothetical protein
MIVGTRLIHVGRWRSTVSHQVETLKRCGATMLPPVKNGVTVAITCPLM